MARTKRLSSALAAVITAASMLAATIPVMAADGYNVTIENVTVNDKNIVTEIQVEVKAAETATAYAAVYNLDGTLSGIDSAEITLSGTYNFNNNLEFDAENQILKCYVWEGTTPVSEVYTPTASTATPAAATATPAAPSATATPSETETPSSEGYTATFSTDSGVASIDIYYTQDYTAANETDVTSALARNSATGEADTTGDGQINFLINLEDGYELDTVTASANYKNIKDCGDNIYRITKITGDLTVTVTTTASNPDATAAPTATPAVTGSGTIHLMGTYIDISEVDAGAELDVSATVVTITAPGTYTVDGTLSDGQIVVNYTASASSDTATLNLDGITLTSTTGNAIDIQSGLVTVASAADTTSTVTSTTGVGIYSAENLEIKGSGTLNVVSTTGNGIRSKETVEIGAGTLNVTAGNNGIKGDEEVKLTKKCGTVTINSTGDGIKSDNAPTVKKPSRTGVVTINGGTIDITTGSETDADTGEVSNGDGIQADTLLTIANSPVITINAQGEAIKANFSHLDLMSTGGYDDVADTLAEGDGCIAISGGTITATAGEDGIKAAKDIAISGGTVTITSAGDDGIQSGDVVYDTTDSKNPTFNSIEGSITISGGKVEIKKTAGDGIITTGTYTESDGDVTIVSAKDGVQAGKAYTALDIGTGTDDETVLYETTGVVNITGGALDITAAGGATRSITDNDGNTTLNDIDYSCKGIKARKLINITGGTLDVNSLDDAVHSNHTARISGGTISAQSCDDGIHGEYYLYISDDAYINVTKSYEGIEGSKIYISGGETYVVSKDDGANAAGDEPTDSAYTLDTVYTASSASTSSASSVSMMAGGFNPGGGWNQPGGGNDNSASYGYLEVSGGLLYIEAEGDGFDSNGSGLISGGTVLVNGPSATSGGNGVFDIGDSSSDTLIITGGTVIGAGTSSMAVTPNSSTGSQAYVVTTTTSSYDAGKAIQVLSGSNEIISYIPSKSYKWIFVSTSGISSGSSYTVKYGGSYSGGSWGANYNSTYGIKTGGSFSGGSSSSATAVTGGSSGSSQPGQPGQPGGR